MLIILKDSLIWVNTTILIKEIVLMEVIVEEYSECGGGRVSIKKLELLLIIRIF
jgi:hypothetical protein